MLIVNAKGNISLDETIKKSISFGRLGLMRLSEIKEKEKYTGLPLKAKNNLAVCITFCLWPSAEDRKAALEFSEENYQIAQNNTHTESPKYIYEATRALVLLRFSKNSGAAEKIHNELLNQVIEDGIDKSKVPKKAREEISENKKFIEKIIKLKPPSV